MAEIVSGISGSLFPAHYLSERVLTDAHDLIVAASVERRRHAWRWWRSVEASSGPATGLRALFDTVAMPLFGMLGYRARDARFEAARVRVQLATPAGTTVALVLVPWASRPPGIWRDLFACSHDSAAPWCFVLAPPFLSLVDVRGRATRRSVDVVLPDALAIESFPRFWALTAAAVFDPPQVGAEAPIDALVRRAAGYQAGVRADLQRGVIAALGILRDVTNARSEALVLVYRILFLQFAEARHLVPHDHRIYENAYSLKALLARAMTADDMRGAWDSLAAITRLSRAGCRTDDLIVRPFNGALFARRSAPSLEAHASVAGRTRRQAARDEAMTHTLVALGSRPGRSGREAINYSDLGVEQLGAVYERVLDLAPESPQRGGHSSLRKQTGTFYTPQPLAEFVVRRTLAPLVAGASADRLLSLRVLDPAMGSGAFLVAACRYLTGAYERALIDEGRLAPHEVTDDLRTGFRRLIAERCLAGVDINPTAVQLARLSLWLTTLAHGRPLTFLDHRLRVGNSVIGAGATDLSQTIARRRRNSPALPLFDGEEFERSMSAVVRPLHALGLQPDDSLPAVRAKEASWERLNHHSSAFARLRRAADVWCARWFTSNQRHVVSAPELRAIVDALLRSDRTLPTAHLAQRLREAQELSRQQGFFHWNLEFGDVFYDDMGCPKADAGFDAVLGNPPWEMLRRGSDRSGAVEPGLSRFIRESGLYPSCGRGHLNLYQPFLERALSLCRTGGRVGLIVPWGLLVDDGAAELRRALIASGSLDTLIGMDNADALFPVHRGVRFAVVVASPGRGAIELRARFGVRSAEELDALPGRDEAGASSYPVRLSRRTIEKIGGPALRIPDARHPDDVRFLQRITDEFPPLGAVEGWSARFSRELNATDDRKHFGRAGLPVVEGKHLAPFQVRVGAVRAFVPPGTAARLLPGGRYAQARLGYRDVSSVGNMRPLIAAVLPPNVVTTHTIFCLRTEVSRDATDFLCGVFNSLVMNHVVRLLMGGHVTTSLAEQLPVPVWTMSRQQRRIARMARRLARYWSEQVTAELEADVAELYGVESLDYRRIADGFPLVSEGLRSAAIANLGHKRRR